MTLATVNKLIGAGIALPLAVAVWGAFTSNPYLVIGVALVALVLSFLLVFTGTVVGGMKIIRGTEQPRTRDLLLVAVGANAIVLAVAVEFVVFGGRGA